MAYSPQFGIGEIPRLWSSGSTDTMQSMVDPAGNLYSKVP